MRNIPQELKQPTIHELILKFLKENNTYFTVDEITDAIKEITKENYYRYSTDRESIIRKLGQMSNKGEIKRYSMRFYPNTKVYSYKEIKPLTTDLKEYINYRFNL